MKKLLFILAGLAGLLICIIVANQESSNDSSIKEERVNIFEAPKSEKYQALDAAQSFVLKEFPDAKFIEDGTIIEETSVDGRYKILQTFESELGAYSKYVYRIWLQRFDDNWEYGNFGIEAKYSGERILTKNGRMKELERSKIYEQSDGSLEGIDYTIIKRNKPGYILIYTKSKLKKQDLKVLYEHYKNEYESVHYTIDKNPDNPDYFCVQDNLVFDFDKNEVYKFSDWYD